MSDTIERIHEEPLYRCASVKKTDDDSQPGGCFNFNKQAKRDGKKGEKAFRKLIPGNEGQPADDIREEVPDEADKAISDENRCGKIIDIEA